MLLSAVVLTIQSISLILYFGALLVEEVDLMALRFFLLLQIAMSGTQAIIAIARLAS